MKSASPIFVARRLPTLPEVYPALALVALSKSWRPLGATASLARSFDRAERRRAGLLYCIQALALILHCRQQASVHLFYSAYVFRRCIPVRCPLRLGEEQPHAVIAHVFLRDRAWLVPRGLTFARRLLFAFQLRMPAIRQ